MTDINPIYRNIVHEAINDALDTPEGVTVRYFPDDDRLEVTGIDSHTAAEIEQIAEDYLPLAADKRATKEATRQIAGKAFASFAKALKDQFSALDLPQLRDDFIRHYKA